MTARSDQTPAVIFSCKSWHRKRKLTTVRTAPFLIFIIDVSTRIVKRALLSYAASPKISSADHKAACIFPDTDGSPDAFCRILLYSDTFMLHLIYRASASFYGHFNAFSVLFGASKMHIFVFLELPVFSRNSKVRPMHLFIQFYYSQMPFVCQ